MGESVTKITVDLSAVRRTTWQQFAARFLVGGTITVLVGVVGKEFGPEIGGLFLAFPAIFPASATLIEKHELQKKQRAGVNGQKRSRDVAGVDAAGAAMGCAGLLAFAFTVYKMLPRHPAVEVLSVAMLIWMTVAVLVWRIHKAS